MILLGFLILGILAVLTLLILLDKPIRIEITRKNIIEGFPTTQPEDTTDDSLLKELDSLYEKYGQVDETVKFFNDIMQGTDNADGNK